MLMEFLSVPYTLRAPSPGDPSYTVTVTVLTESPRDSSTCAHIRRQMVSRIPWASGLQSALSKGGQYETAMCHMAKPPEETKRAQEDEASLFPHRPPVAHRSEAKALG